MTRKPQEVVFSAEDMVLEVPVTELSGDEIVISGISGIFPRSDNVEEFMENLINNVDMVTNSNEESWHLNHPQMAKHLGKVNGLNKFDAQFFGVPHGQSENLDSMARKLLENAYGALFDAGINPKTLAGTKLGVFSGTSFIDIGGVNLYDVTKKSNYTMIGSSKTMLANRISYWLDVKGPSYSIDDTCASSMAALEHAYRAIQEGFCSSAIVAGSNLCLHPKLTLNLRCAGFLCLDGKTKCFDKNADGYVRSEAIGVLFLQKSRDAKRIYAEVVHMKEKYFTRPDSNFLPLRKSEDIIYFLREFYSEVEVSPKCVEYLEAFGAGIQIADENELRAISDVFAKDGTIKVGCVKSNMGHSEGASDLCALTKLCLAYHTGQLPANLHYKEPQDHIPAINDGRIQIVTETTPFRRGYTAINSFSYAGNNHHALMKGHFKLKELDRYNSPIPRLVLASGRMDDNVSKIFESLKSHPIDPEQIALLHDFFAIGISGHTCRGYLILDTNEKNETISLAESINHFPGTKAPVWFLYSGMGSQWHGMGAELMRIPAFASTIERCHKVLEPKGIDLVKIITTQDKSIFENILHSFVGIAAIQIGLTDLLKEMGIVPDNIIGHSLGELGCAYADDCFTAEEMMLLSYCRGLVSVETKFIDGLMAAVGLGYKTLSSLCPPEIEIACHNSSESSTISGPADIVRKFIKTLETKNIFAKEVETSKIAFHSKYVAEAGPRFLSEMKKIIKFPKQRSDKWLCTSAPPQKWDLPETKYSSAEYFTNNFLEKVYFYEAARNIPENATVIEIAPHGLMQAIMTKSHKTCTHISLTRRGRNSNPVNFLLEAVGRLFQAGLTPKIDFLYPKIEYPVSTETPLLSPLVGWAHDEDWLSATYNKQCATTISARDFAMTINDDDWNYLKGHVKNGVTIFPEAALLVLVWETLAMYKGLNYRNMSVIFEDIRFEKELLIKNKETVRFTIEIQLGCCRFEITDQNCPIASGLVKFENDPQIDPYFEEGNETCDDVVLTTKEIYMLFGARGFSYADQFQSILSSNIKRNSATIKWTNEWVTFIDSLIQLNILSRDHDGVSSPKFIRKLIINTQLQKGIVTNEVNAYYDMICDLTRCGGIQINNIVFTDTPILEKESGVLEIRTFVPHFYEGQLNMESTLKVNLQIIAKNIADKYLNVTELITESSTIKLTETVTEIFDNSLWNYGIQINNTKIVVDETTLEIEIDKKQKFGTSNLFILHNIMNNDMIQKKIFSILRNNSFVLAIEHNEVNFEQDKQKNFDVITSISVGEYKMILLRKIKTKARDSYIIVEHENVFSWLPNMRRELESGKRVVLVSKHEICCLLGLVKALKKEGFGNISVIMIHDLVAPKFSPEIKFYKEQIKKHLTFNVFAKGVWGDYYYLSAKQSKSSVKNVMLVSKNIGGTESLTWHEIPVLPYGKRLVQVSYAAISKYTCQKSGGEMESQNGSFGMDYSGYDVNDEKVMGLVPCGALSSTVNPNPELLWPVPKHWSLEDAATVPLPYIQAYYCLMVQNKLQKNCSVLVLDGAGALGQAIISICLDLNCTVFTSVDNRDKKQFLLKMFPKLKDKAIH